MRIQDPIGQHSGLIKEWPLDMHGEEWIIWIICIYLCWNASASWNHLNIKEKKGSNHQHRANANIVSSSVTWVWHLVFNIATEIMFQHGESSALGPLAVKMHASRKVSGAIPLSNMKTSPPAIEVGNGKSTTYRGSSRSNTMCKGCSIAMVDYQRVSIRQSCAANEYFLAKTRGDHKGTRNPTVEGE